MADQEIIKHTKAIIELAKDRNKKWQHRLREIMLEIAIIVFAVSISIWFHNWSDSWKDRREERDFFIGLKKDLLADMEEMNHDRNSYIAGLAAVHYFEKVGAGATLNTDSLNLYQGIFFGYIQISPRVSRFEALKGSGRLDIIRNKELLVNITDLYQKDFPRIEQINDYFNSLRKDGFFPFISSHLKLDSAGSGTNWQELLRTSQLRLFIYLGEGVVKGIDYYSSGIGKVQMILRDIDEELK